MQLIRRKNQKEINTNTCGLLLEVLDTPEFPCGVVLSENIKPTKAHRNTKSKKLYWLIKGNITVKVQDVKTREISVVKMNAGDLLILAPTDVHQITEASKENTLITVKAPGWHEWDEEEQKIEK